MEQKPKQTSADYILRCAEIIKADPNVSEKTITIMFLEYGRLLLNEKLKQNGK